MSQRLNLKIVLVIKLAEHGDTAFDPVLWGPAGDQS